MNISNLKTQLKTLAFPVSIFLVTFVLTQVMSAYFQNLDMNNLHLLGLPKMLELSLLLALLIGLSMPSWTLSKYILIVPLPLSLGVYLNLLFLEPLNALIATGLIFSVLLLGLFRSIRLRDSMIKPQINTSLRPAIKSYLMAMSIASAFIVLLNPQKKEINLSEMVSNTIKKPVSSYVISTVGLGSRATPEINSLMEQQVEREIDTEVKKALEPYRYFANIIFAIAVFAGMQGINTIIYAVYAILISPIYQLAFAIKLIKKESREVTQEYLSF